MTTTVIGATGFIGGALIKELEKSGVSFYAPKFGKNYEIDNELFKRNLGDIIYAAGMTSNYRNNPLQTFDSHCGLLLNIIKNCSFDTITYLSSTRVYIRTQDVAKETSLINTAPDSPEDTYTISKICGESITLSSGKGKVCRLSNVISCDNMSSSFISTIGDEAKLKGEVRFELGGDSRKDYISLNDALNCILAVSKNGHGIYNVASGTSISIKEISQVLGKYKVKTVLNSNGKNIEFPEINVSRIRDSFSIIPKSSKEVIESYFKHKLG